MNAKMQPFYVVVENDDGSVAAYYANKEGAERFCSKAASDDLFRIEHVRDQSALMEELRQLRKRIDRMSFIGDADVADHIEAILSRHGRE